VYYWAWKNNIPVFCPALTDGAIGDILFTNSFKNDLVIDIVKDVHTINRLAMKAKKSGVIILGGSVPKHHILNANIWRNGADFGVFINTGLFEDGSDSGAKIE
jgi:deoxyhypusine synthase